MVRVTSFVPRMVSFVLRRGGWCVVSDDYDYHQEVARAAFADMLHDDERNAAYRKALEFAIERLRRQNRPVHVLDIGTGTGLLSMMAARAGADSIIACEAFRPMADCARKIIEKNGFGDKIRLVPKRSTEMTVGEGGDMEWRANLLVTEVFDTELIGEGAIETFRHAHSELLEKDCFVVPDSATMYAQVVECPALQRWNKLTDVIVDGEPLVKTPLEIKKCPGGAALHDIQLSQVARSSFKEITEPIPIFQFDWSGKTPIQKFEQSSLTKKALVSGSAEMVFVWWDLKMDPEGEILSCAPWWHHPLADMNAEHPENSIPWRDHWMQAVYYFPEPSAVMAGDDVFLHSLHDEFSLWFDLSVKNDVASREYLQPLCECGAHMLYSRTHISYMNDEEKNARFYKALKSYINEDTVLVCLNGASLIGLMAAKMGAKKVIYVEASVIGKKILESFIRFNDLTKKVSILPGFDSLTEQVSMILCDPHFSGAILPWDNFEYGERLLKLRLLLREDFKIMPFACTLWMMSVEFMDLHKIKAPLGVCEGIDLSLFDDLIKNSRDKSEDGVEPQPLWEYPCVCRTLPVKIVDVDFRGDLKTPLMHNGFVKCNNSGRINGFVFWLEWKLNDDPSCNILTGPLETPELNEKVKWDPSIRQGVKILETSQIQNEEDSLSYSFFYNPGTGLVKVNADLCKNKK